MNVTAAITPTMIPPNTPVSIDAIPMMLTVSIPRSFAQMFTQVREGSMGGGTILAVLALGAMTSTARADPIGPNCGSCFGNIIALTGGTIVGSTSTTDTYRFELDVNAAGTNLGAGTFLNAAAIKTFEPPELVSVSLVSGPAAGWSASIIGLNSGGCGGGSGGFVCASGTGISVPTNTLLTWIFDITVTAGSTITATPSVKLSFVNAAGGNKGLTSENITVQEVCPTVVCNPQELPEPGVLVLLAIGLLALGFTTRTGRRPSV